MITKKMETAMTEHLNREFYSAYFYMSMSAESSLLGLKGFATWFMAQYHEEMFHAMKIYEYLSRQGCRADLKTIDAPPGKYASPLDMFSQTHEHEKTVTSHINDLMELAILEKDHATQIFLHWFVSEQVEEEDTVNDIVARLKLVRDDPNGLFLMDKELSVRTVNIPTDYSRGISAGIVA